MEQNEITYGILGTGGVEYSIEEAAVEIDALIAALEEAKEDGVTHIVASSGNYRGAQWEKVYASVTFADED